MLSYNLYNLVDYSNLPVYRHPPAIVGIFNFEIGILHKETQMTRE